MAKLEKKTFQQSSAYQSPWNFREKLGMALWQLTWVILFRPTPKPANRWRLVLLRLFGARVHPRAYVSNSASIRIPWHLELRDRACIGEKVVVYNLGRIVLKERSTVAQECYLCAGTHDLTVPTLPLVTAPIIVGEDAFVGARAMILPGVTISRGAVVGAGSVVREDVATWMIVAGNPAVTIRERRWSGPR